MYDLTQVGPALKRLREARGLRQADVAHRAEVSDSIPSRAEQPDSNIQLGTLFRYLAAIEASLTDLDNELRPDPLGDEIARDDQRLLDEPGHRETYRRLWEAGYKPDPDGPLGHVLKILEDHEVRDREIFARIRKLEEEVKDGD